MKISISNKKLNSKPSTDREKSIYFKDLKFKSGSFKTEDIKEIIGNGYTLTYLFKDNEFDRRNHYMSNNYLGTQFICVDIDKCDVSPNEFVDMVKYKPSVVHTTFSNLTENKDNKYCYHLLYFFDKIIYGEDNFHYIFNLLTEDYKDFIDKQAMDCHRVMFTSNSSLKNYEYYDYGITYKVDDFISDEDNQWDKNSEADIYNISKTIYKEINEMSQSTTSFSLDKKFLKDMYKMTRGEFIYTYSSTYPYITETYIDPQRYENGYADLRNDNYYVIPTAQYRWDSERNKPYIPKIQAGMRNTMIWLDAHYFINIVPEITKEHLVYLLTTEVYRNFDNSDNQITNQFIINKCKEVWESRDRIHVKPIPRSFKIDKTYWNERGMDNWLSISNYIRKQMKCDDFGNLYDYSLTLEQNIKEFRNYGVNTTSSTLRTWLEENGIQYTTDKELRDEHVITLYNEDPSRSSRELERLCNVNYRTIQRILKKYKEELTA